MVLQNPLIPINSSPPHAIDIKNDGRSSIQVGISGANRVNGSLAFYYEIGPGVVLQWKRSRTELVFINGGGFGRVAVAAAGPGSYIVPELQYTDPNVGYVFNSVSDKIGVKNNLGTSIKIKITANTGGSPKFFDVLPGVTSLWGRTGLETIFVKYSSSDILLTYLGIPGQNLHIDRQSTSGAPIYPYVRTLTAAEIGVSNEQSSTIIATVSDATISNATHPSGSALFYAKVQGQRDDVWTRHGPEVICVNGPTGTAVGTYYAKTEHELVVNSPIAL